MIEFPRWALRLDVLGVEPYQIPWCIPWRGKTMLVGVFLVTMLGPVNLGADELVDLGHAFGDVVGSAVRRILIISGFYRVEVPARVKSIICHEW